MTKLTVRTAAQLPILLQSLRKDAGLSQQEVARQLGVSQQTYSAMERNADKVGAARLLKLLQVLGVDLVLAKEPVVAAPPQATDGGDRPIW